MGVPRFFRWLSERYPCIMEYIDPNTCPEFDNLYLDMNGVIHACSHPSDDVHFRLPEDVIFRNIISYVDYLFNMIAPKKVLFLSVDGVAPRSKMNQQRSRRYKSAKEAIEKEAKARANNEDLPITPRFDSNCITPGTEFMTKLHFYMLEEFSKRVQNNPSWNDVEIIYSGFDVPGEGEHKIMDYIRTCRSNDKTQAEEIRHCLYGLDADLINLGLCSHEPFFSILREEVRFGRQSNNKRKTGDANTTKFQLLHLSILRDYLDAEFSELKTTLQTFSYNLENIIDDWILMNFLIGNDFLPHVPMFHVIRGSLEILYKTYIKVLPTLTGYMSTNGHINLDRFKKFLSDLAVQDLQVFKKNYIEMEDYADALNALTFGDSQETSDLTSPEEEVSSTDPTDMEDLDDFEDLGTDDNLFESHKRAYYQEKLHFNENFSEQVNTISNEYIRGIQWVLYYYYRGCPSWNWFYPFYYAPYVSDLSIFNIDEIKFTLSAPFPPLVQLLAVLPVPSRHFLPVIFQGLIGNEVSPLARFFPEKVEVDYNEKKQDYEAIVLIPFIDEDVIMTTYETCKIGFTSNEKRRNNLGFHYSLIHSEDIVSNSDDSLSCKYPNVKFIKHNWDAFILDHEKILYGIRKNININVINGFPTMKGISYETKLTHARLKIYDFPSKDLSIILNIKNQVYSDNELSTFVNKFSNRIVYINWPLISEAKLSEVMSVTTRFYKDLNKKLIIEANDKENWGYAKQGTLSYLGKQNAQKGIHFEEPQTIVKVYKLESQQFVIVREKCILEKRFSDKPIYLPMELLVSSEEALKKPPPYKDLRNIFIPGKQYFLIGRNYYGVKAEVVNYVRDGPFGSVTAKIFLESEPNFNSLNEFAVFDKNYIPEGHFLKIVSKKFNISTSSAKKIVGSIIVGVKTKSRTLRINLGLKFRYQQKSLPGYSYVEEYSDNLKYYFNLKCLDVIKLYYDAYPFVFQMIQNSNNFEQIELDSIMPGMAMEEKSKIALGIKDWLDTLHHNQLDHFSPSVPYVDTPVVKEIERCVQSHVYSEVIIQATVTPREFFIPEFILRGDVIPDSRTKFRLYDRVVNIKSNCSVPYGEKGTVIGIYQKMNLKEYSGIDLNVNDLNPDDPTNLIVEILFDNEFMGAISNRSSRPNVARMKPAWVINISFGIAMNKNLVSPVASMMKNRITPQTSTPSSTLKNNFSSPKTLDPSAILKQAMNIQTPSLSSEETNQKICSSSSSPNDNILKQLIELSNKTESSKNGINVKNESLVKKDTPIKKDAPVKKDTSIKKDVSVKKDVPPVKKNMSAMKENGKTKNTLKVHKTPIVQSFDGPFKVDAADINAKIFDSLNLNWSLKEGQASLNGQPKKVKGIQENKNELAIPTKKEVKIKKNMFVPTSVQRKAAPKGKTQSTELNHSANSPFKSLTKRQDRIATIEPTNRQTVPNLPITVNAQSPKSPVVFSSTPLNPLAKVFISSGFSGINIKTTSQIKQENVSKTNGEKKTDNLDSVPPPPNFMPPASWVNQ